MIEFDDTDATAIRQAYVDTYRREFGAWDVPDSAILARFAAESGRPSVQDVANLRETAVALERILKVSCHWLVAPPKATAS
jgi:hypothetical protein